MWAHVKGEKEKEKKTEPIGNVYKKKKLWHPTGKEKRRMTDLLPSLVTSELNGRHRSSKGGLTHDKSTRRMRVGWSTVYRVSGAIQAHIQKGQYLDGSNKEGERKSLQIGPPPCRVKPMHHLFFFACHFPPSLSTKRREHPLLNAKFVAQTGTFGISFFDQSIDR